MNNNIDADRELIEKEEEIRQIKGSCPRCNKCTIVIQTGEASSGGKEGEIDRGGLIRGYCKNPKCKLQFMINMQKYYEII